MLFVPSTFWVNTSDEPSIGDPACLVAGATRRPAGGRRQHDCAFGDDGGQVQAAAEQLRALRSVDPRFYAMKAIPTRSSGGSWMPPIR